MRLLLMFVITHPNKTFPEKPAQFQVLRWMLEIELFKLYPAITRVLSIKIDHVNILIPEAIKPLMVNVRIWLNLW